MHSAPHRNNSDFQLRHFIAGGCRTPDAAWNVLYEQMLDVRMKIEATKANLIRRKAVWLDLEASKQNIRTEQDRLRYEASMIEYNSMGGILELALAGAERELGTIQKLMDELEPQRKYKHLPFLEATEASQNDEWREEFKARIENYLVSQGSIPHDQLDAMRSHPEFTSHILPHMKKTALALENAGSAEKAVMLLANEPLKLGGNTSGD